MIRQKNSVLLPGWLVAVGFVIAFSPAAAQAPFDSETYDLGFSKGVVAFGDGRYEEAAVLFEKAVKAKPGDAEAT